MKCKVSRERANGFRVFKYLHKIVQSKDLAVLALFGLSLPSFIRPLIHNNSLTRLNQLNSLNSTAILSFRPTLFI
jgi:hypothetical protein